MLHAAFWDKRVSLLSCHLNGGQGLIMLWSWGVVLCCMLVASAAALASYSKLGHKNTGGKPISVSSAIIVPDVIELPSLDLVLAYKVECCCVHKALNRSI